MYAAYAGIRQSKIRDRENAFRVARTWGGSVKKVQNVTLSVNCAETVRPSEMMPETKNVRKYTGLATVKTASFQVKGLILEKIFFATGVR